MNLVSCVIPTLGRPSLMDAIASALNQPEVAEVIVVVDENAPQTLKQEISSDDKVRYYFPHLGGAANLRNFGIQKSQAKFIGFLDDDDYWLPNFAADLIAEYSMDTEIVAGSAVVNYGRRTVLRPKELFIGKSQSQLFRNLYKSSWGPSKIYIPIDAILIPRELLSKISFDPKLNIREDIKFISELSIHGIKQIRSPVVVINTNRTRAWHRESMNSALEWYEYVWQHSKISALNYLIFEFARTFVLSKISPFNNLNRRSKYERS